MVLLGIPSIAIPVVELLRRCGVELYYPDTVVYSSSTSLKLGWRRAQKNGRGRLLCVRLRTRVLTGGRVNRDPAQPDPVPTCSGASSWHWDNQTCRMLGQCSAHQHAAVGTALPMVLLPLDERWACSSGSHELLAPQDCHHHHHPSLQHLASPWLKSR